MLDINIVRNSLDFVKNALRRRGTDYPVDELFNVDKQWRENLKELERLRALKNKFSTDIRYAKGEDKQKMITAMKDVTSKIKTLEATVEGLEKRRQELLDIIPNIPHESVPDGTGDENAVELKRWGDFKPFDFEPLDHIDLGLKLDLMDIERGAKVAGARFYYLKNGAVKLQLAIGLFAINELVKKGFTPIYPPVLVHGDALYGTGFLPLAREDVYKIENEDLYLVGTAEVPLGAMHSDEIFEYKELPKWYCGWSSCFRTEAGAHGRDTKGIFRVHQFEKVEMFKFCLPDKSWEEHEHLLQCAEELVQKLGLPYRVVNIPAGDLGSSAAKKYDVEVYLPGQKKFRELISCSNCTDYQARRLQTRFRDKDGNFRYVHTLNSTALATARTLVAIMENYQQKDGTILVPEVLREFVGADKVGSRE